jgi:uncharacterized membrane-anchored protein YitT (DUF2179 family)
MNAFLIDNIIEGLNIKINVRVISNKADDIKLFVINELSRGATIFTAEGGYSKSPVRILSTVLTKREFIKIKAYIREVDENAFVTVANVREVIGEGFKSV